MAKAHLGKAAAMGAAFAIGSGSASAAHLQYSLDAGVEDNDNIGLATIDPIHRTFFRTGLGFLFDHDSSAIQANLSGRVDYRDYHSSHFDNALDGTLSGRFNWAALPERLHFTVEDNLSVQTIDTLVPDTPVNRQQVNVVSLGPTLFFRPGETFHGQAELRYVDSRAEVTDEFNSQRTGLALRAIKDFSSTSLLSFSVVGQNIDFAHDTVARDYDHYEAYVRYAQRLRDFDFGLEGGYSRLQYKDGQRRGDPLIRGNAIWHPSTRSQLTFSAATMLSDSASDSLANLLPGTAVPENSLIGSEQVTSSAYHVKRLELGYHYIGTLVDVSITPYQENRDYIDPSVLDQDEKGGRFDFNWRLRSTLSLGVFATVGNTDYATINRLDRTHYAGVSLQKDWSRKWSSRLEYARYERTSSLAGQDANQNILYASIVYRNR